MKRNVKGFTLIEVIVAVTLVVVAAMLMYSFFGQGFSLYSVATESADEQMNLRQVLSEITNIVRVTEAHNISVNNNVLTVGSKVYKLQGGSILRNGTAIASRIQSFNVSISAKKIMDISIANNKGTILRTSLSLDAE